MLICIYTVTFMSPAMVHNCALPLYPIWSGLCQQPEQEARPVPVVVRCLGDALARRLIGYA